MAIFLPIISEFNDKGIKGAQAAFDDFKKKVGEADGAMGKMKAGFSAAGDFIKANAAQFTAVAGAAIAGFVVKAVGQFQDLALAVDKFRDATGVTLDEASRWTEVAGDIGVDAGTIEVALNRMNKQASDGSGLFKELGVQLKRHKDGEFDPHATFLDVIDALKNIKDPADKARIASGLLGKGWQEMANLIEEGSGPLLARMREVSEAKLINEDEVKKAEAYRDAVDKLGDAWGDFVTAVGENLAPLLANLASTSGAVLGALDDIGKAIGNVKQLSADQWVDQVGFEKTIEILDLTYEEIIDLAKAIDKDLVPQQYEMLEAWLEGNRAMIDARKVADDTTKSIGNLEQAIAELKGEIDERQAWRNLQEDIQRAGETAITAFKEQTPEALRASEEAIDNARLAAAEYIAKLDDIPDDVKTEIIADLDDASVAEIESILADLTRRRTVDVLVRSRRSEVGSGGREQGTAPPGFETVNTPFGSFTRPTDGSGDWRFASERSAMNLMGPANAGGTTVVVNVAGSVTTQNDLVESVRKGLVNAQRNGSGLVYTNF